MELNGDLSRRVVLDTNRMDWSLDPVTGVWSKPLDRVFSGAWKHTGILRFPPGALVTECCLGGAEILVLEGVLSDTGGDYPSGSYLRLPACRESFPASRAGCILFMKRGHPGPGEGEAWALHPDARAWRPGLVPGLRVLSLGEFEGVHSALVDWAPGTRFPYHRHYGGEEIFVMSGVFQDEHGDYPAGTWMRSPHLSDHVPFSEQGCLIFVKLGHLPPSG